VRGLEDYVKQLCAHAGSADTADARTAQHAALARIAHKLTGTGGTYGFPAITEAARALEHALKRKSQDNEIGDAVRKVEAACREAMS
jgi:HPt (histidine-containing phosphotransfer) domain-containing protein